MKCHSWSIAIFSLQICGHRAHFESLRHLRQCVRQRQIQVSKFVRIFNGGWHRLSVLDRDRKYLAFFNIFACVQSPEASIIDGCKTPQVCVEHCPSITFSINKYSNAQVKEQEANNAICLYDVQPTAQNVGTTVPFEYFDLMMWFIFSNRLTSWWTMASVHASTSIVIQVL